MISLFSDVGTAYNAFVDARRESRLKDKRKEGVDHGTRLDVHKRTDEAAFMPIFRHMLTMVRKVSDIPKRGTYEYVVFLDNLWKDEPILAGAVYSMEAKMQAMTWRVEGGKINSGQVARMLARARYISGNDWSGFIGSSAIDFYTQDSGVFWDITRQSEPYGKMTDLATVDTRCCTLTGSATLPVYYQSNICDQEIWYKPGQYIHFTSMPSPNELDLGAGTCAISRAARAAKLLMALHSYDAEKLANLPPEGIATVTGMTDREFRQAIALWKAERKRNSALTFPQVLWLIGSNPNAKITVDISSFSTIPESYDRQTVVAQYVNTLALDFGVDTREFWAISTGALGTASEAEVQHLKARGKGGGEFISLVERSLNAELPQDVTFEFDTQDIEEDMVAASVAKAWVDAYIGLVFPQSGGEAIIDGETFKRLLADKGVLPEWAVGDNRVAIASGEIHKDTLGDIVAFIWRCGKLKEVTLIKMARQPVIVEGEILKDNGSEPAIVGTPIQDSEVERGARVTRKSIEAELALWGDIPELAPLLEGSQ